MLITNPQPFRDALIKALFSQASRSFGSLQDDYLSAAAALERGDKAPHWIADRFVPLAGQNAFGVCWMRLSIPEQARVVDMYIK